jgi:hypothetical protein
METAKFVHSDSILTQAISAKKSVIHAKNGIRLAGIAHHAIQVSNWKIISVSQR